MTSFTSNPDDVSQLHPHKEVVDLHATDQFEITLTRIGRTHQGPNSTPGGGECALFATLQALEPDSAEYFCQQASSCMHIISKLRLDVKNVVLKMKHDDLTRKSLVDAIVRTTVAAQASMADRDAIWSSEPDWDEVAENLGKLVAGMLDIMYVGL
jgi:hypothetical protein